MQAWLGYYNGALKRVGWRKEDLVAAANAMVLNVWGAKEVCLVWFGLVWLGLVWVGLVCRSCHVRP